MSLIPPTHLSTLVRMDLDEVRETAAGFSNQMADVRLLQQLVLAATEVNPDAATLCHSVSLRLQLLRELGLLDEVNLLTLENELKVLITEKSTKADAWCNLMERMAYLVTDPSVEAANYKTTAKLEIQKVIAGFSEEQRTDATLLAERMLEFVGGEYENWLDIALLREGTRLQMGLRAANVDAIHDIAGLLFGKHSRVRRRLNNFKRLSATKKVKAAAAMSLNFSGVALSTYMMYQMSRGDQPLDYQTFFQIAFVVMGAISAGFGYTSLRELRKAHENTKQAVSRRYEQLDVPKEVVSFVEIMMKLQKDIIELNQMEASLPVDEARNRLAVLAAEITEAKALLAQNREMFNEAPQKQGVMSWREKPLSGKGCWPSVDAEVLANLSALAEQEGKKPCAKQSPIRIGLGGNGGRLGSDRPLADSGKYSDKPGRE